MTNTRDGPRLQTRQDFEEFVDFIIPYYQPEGVNQMAKKKTKKKVSSISDGEIDIIIDSIVDSDDDTSPVDEMVSLAGCLRIVQLGVMADRFGPKADKVAGQILKLADSLKSAIDVYEKRRAKESAIRERLLTRAARYEAAD